jgi:hypothetical protein
MSLGKWASEWSHHIPKDTLLLYAMKDQEIPQNLTQNMANIFGFEVLTVVVMKISIFWDIKTCSPLKVNHVSEEHVASTFRLKE